MAPPAPWLPKEIHGKPIIALFVCDTGAIKEGERRVASIKAFGAPVGDVIQRRTYVSQQSLLDATQPKGRATIGSPTTCPSLKQSCSPKQSSMPSASCRLTR